MSCPAWPLASVQVSHAGEVGGGPLLGLGAGVTLSELCEPHTAEPVVTFQQSDRKDTPLHSGYFCAVTFVIHISIHLHPPLSPSLIPESPLVKIPVEKSPLI